MKTKLHFWTSFAFFKLGLCLGAASPSRTQAPDLTRSDLSTINRESTYNLGPTGMRGWIYLNQDTDAGQQGLMTATPPWQILVTTVGTNTPAAGILDRDDVILGVSAGTGQVPVPLFTGDSRKCLCWQIGEAEAQDGVLNIKRWRAGTTQDVSIHLQTLGGYSATSPYNCPKSELILSNACNILNKELFPDGPENSYPGPPILGLALLATGDAKYWPVVRNYARSVGPATLSLRYPPGESAQKADTWGWGYNGVFLAEYYLRTGDTNVLHAINEYTVALAQSQSRYGTFGHGGSLLAADGSLHGTIPPYGPVNQAGLVANLAIILGKKCLRESGEALDPEIVPAIERASRFFGYYVQKGNIPYGEHEPWYYHAGNGKESLAALMFAMMGNQPAETEYFTRMTLAGYNGREYGHTGQGFSFLWSPLAASLGGTNALAAYWAQIRWHLDLERRCDGSFVYDGEDQYGGSSGITNYWQASSYYELDPTACYVLTYALARQQIYLTGRNSNPANWLSQDQVTNAIWAGMFDQHLSDYDTNQLMSALAEYDPLVRGWAAVALGRRTNVAPLVPGLIRIAGSSTSAQLREAACHALGVTKNTNALPLLVQELSDPDVWVRAQAANALRSFGAAASPQLSNMLIAFTKNATDPDMVAWEDPVQLANSHLSFELFGDAVYHGNDVTSYTVNAPKNLLNPAIEAGLRQPDSNPRSGVASFVYKHLSLADIQPLLPAIFEVADTESQADTMWSMDPRASGIETLAKYHIAEAIPLALSMLITPRGFGWNDTGFKIPALNALAAYGAAARWTLPTLKSYLSKWKKHEDQYQALVKTIATLENATNAPPLDHVVPIARSQVVVATRTRPITLNAYAAPDDLLTYSIVSPPVHGTLTGTPPELFYTPANGYRGTDSFTFKINNGKIDSAPGTVILNVGGSVSTQKRAPIQEED